MTMNTACFALRSSQAQTRSPDSETDDFRKKTSDFTGLLFKELKQVTPMVNYVRIMW